MIRKSTSALAVIQVIENLIKGSDHAIKGRRLLKKLEVIEILSDLILNHFGAKTSIYFSQSQVDNSPRKLTRYI